jgi:hypothetical protein
MLFHHDIQKFQSARDLYGQSQIIKNCSIGGMGLKKMGLDGRGGRGNVRKTNEFLSITILGQVG